jgi:excisionase family DNA binding protein
VRWIYGQVEKNSLPAYRLGRSLAFERDAIEAWLKARRVGDWNTCAECHELIEFEVMKRG